MAADDDGAARALLPPGRVRRLRRGDRRRDLVLHGAAEDDRPRGLRRLGRDFREPVVGGAPAWPARLVAAGRRILGAGGGAVVLARVLAAALGAGEPAAREAVEDVFADAPVGHLTAAPAGRPGLVDLVVV